MKYYTIIILTSIVFSSCIKDTCNKRLGDTFQSVEVEGVTISEQGTIVLTIATETLDTLPLAYFEDIDIIKSHSIDTIISNNDQIVVQYKPDSIPMIGDSLSTVIFIDYRDRRRHIDCQHGGSDDTYNLDMTYDFFRKNETDIEIHNFEWMEIFEAGHY